MPLTVIFSTIVANWPPGSNFVTYFVPIAVAETATNVDVPQNTSLATSTVASSSDAKITRTDSTQAAAINALNPAPSIGLTNVVSEKTAASSDTQVEAQAAQGQESAFNFDAKLAKSDAQQNPKALETPVSLAGVAKTNAQVQNASFTPKGAELGIQAAAATGTQIGTNANTSASANAKGPLGTHQSRKVGGKAIALKATEDAAISAAKIASPLKTIEKGADHPAGSKKQQKSPTNDVVAKHYI